MRHLLQELVASVVGAFARVRDLATTTTRIGKRRLIKGTLKGKGTSTTKTLELKILTTAFVLKPFAKLRDIKRRRFRNITTIFDQNITLIVTQISRSHEISDRKNGRSRSSIFTKDENFSFLNSCVVDKLNHSIKPWNESIWTIVKGNFQTFHLL